MRLPDFLGLGGMRCGSSTVWSWMRSHPQVFTPSKKELHFFSNRGGAYGAGVHSYARHFSTAKPGQVIGEVTPEYLSVPEAAQRIHFHMPEVRLYVILRDPVERLWSHYRYLRNSGREKLSLRDAIAAEAHRRAAASEGDCIHDYLNRSRYIEHLERYDRLFDREQLLIILFEEMTVDPVITLCRLAEHIGVNPSGLEVSRDTTRNVKLSDVRWTRVDRLARRLNSWRYAQDSSFAARAARRAGCTLRRLNLRPPLPMDSDQRSLLTQVLKPSVEKLEQWLRRNTGWLSR